MEGASKGEAEEGRLLSEAKPSVPPAPPPGERRSPSRDCPAAPGPRPPGPLCLSQVGSEAQAETAGAAGLRQAGEAGLCAGVEGRRARCWLPRVPSRTRVLACLSAPGATLGLAL